MMQRPLVLTLLIFSFSTFAAEEKRGCPFHLTTQPTINEKFARLEESGKRGREKTVALTHLLNETISPILVKVHAEVTALSAEELKLRGQRVKATGQYGPGDYGAAKGKAMGFDGAFSKIFGDKILFGTTPWSEATMKKLDLALLIIFQYLDHTTEFDEDPVAASSSELLNRHSFTQTSLDQTLRIGFLTIAQAVGQLIADPVAGFSADETLHEVMAAREGDQSLMVQLSLMLRPALIGPYGEVVYFTNPLEPADEGRLKFSKRFREFLKSHRDQWNQAGEKKPYEFGHGCPVAHCLPGSSMGSSKGSSLQLLLDAVMHVYDRI